MGHVAAVLFVPNLILFAADVIVIVRFVYGRYESVTRVQL